MRFFSTICIVITLCCSSCHFISTENKDKKSEQKINNPELLEISNLVKEKPKDAALYFKRSVIYRQLKQDSLAMNDIKKAIALDSTKAYYYSALGDLLFDHKDVSGSLIYIQKAVALDPDDEVAHLKMARVFLFSEEYPKSFVEINTVLRKNVYNPEAYFLKGMCYKYMKDTLKAISSFQTAVQTEPRYAEAHLQLAQIFEMQKNPLALNYFENAYKADTSDLEPLYSKAMYWQNQMNYAEAKKIFSRMVLLDRNYPKSYYNVGWMLMQEDSTEKAIRQFTMAIGVQPDYVAAYYNRGICQEIIQQFDFAKSDYEQALSFKADFADAKKALNRVNQKIKK
jgi:tetratricopeptide (TPR) repeat protein